jgi:hypothetical protein
MTASSATTIQQLNLAYFGRPADPASLVAFPASGMSDEEIVLAFVKTSEYTTNTITPNSVADTDGGRTFNETNLINTFYQRLFGRLAVASEVAGWSSALARGAVNHDYLGITILRAGLNLPEGTAMRDTLLGKIGSAQAFSDNLSENPASAQAYSTSAAALSAASFLSGRTTTATAAEAATAATAMVATGAAAAPVGQSFTLTTSVDVLTGGAAADAFAAGLSTNGTMVLQSADVLTGGEGLDSLTAIFAIGAVTTLTPTLNGIEALTINNATTGDFAGTFDATFSPDLTSVTVTPSTAQTLNVNQLQNTSVALGVTSANLASIVAFDFVDTAVAGAADSASLTLTSNALGTVNVDAAIETLNVASAGSANAITLGHSADTLNISGTAAFTDASANTTSETITVTSSGAVTLASDNANAVTFTGGAGADAITFTETVTLTNTFNGGAGNDSVTFTTDLDDADVVNGGEGTDILVASGADFRGLTAANNISNTETFSVSGALGGALNISTLDTSSTVETLNLAGNTHAGGITFGTGNKTVNAAGDLNAALVVTSDGTSTTDTLTVVNTAAAADDVFETEALTTTGYETVIFNGGSIAEAQNMGAITLNATANQTPTLNLNFTGSNVVTTGVITANVVDASGLTGTATFTNAGATVGVTSITGTANADTLVGSATATTLNGGAGDDTITTNIAGDTVNGGAGDDTIDASAAGDDTINGDAGADAITGGAGNQNLNGGDGNDTIISGTGNDVINGGAGNDTVNMDSALTIQDTVVGGEGSDTLNLDVAATAATASTNVSGFETLRLTGAITQDMAVFASNTTFTTLDNGANSAVVFNNALDTVTTLTSSVTSAGAGTIRLERLVDGAASSIAFNAETDGGTTTVTTLRVDDEETVTLSSGGVVAEDLTVTTLTAADLTTLNVTGTGDVIITNKVGGTAVTTVDATAATGAVTVSVADSTSSVTMTGNSSSTEIATLTGGLAGDTITGGGGADALSGGAGADTITGGAGNDTITGGAGLNILRGGDGDDGITGGDDVDTISSGAGTDTITAAGGIDLIDVTGTGVATIVMTGSGTAIDVVTGFDGTATTGDQVDIDLSEQNAIIAAMKFGAGSTLAASTAVSVEEIGSATLIAGTTVVVSLLGDFADTTEVAAAVNLGGSHEISISADATDLSQGDGYLILWDDGANSYLARLASGAAVAADTADTFATSSTVTNLMQFSGIQTSGFSSSSFDIIA